MNTPLAAPAPPDRHTLFGPDSILDLGGPGGGSLMGVLLLATAVLAIVLLVRALLALGPPRLARTDPADGLRARVTDLESEIANLRAARAPDPAPQT